MSMLVIALNRSRNRSLSYFQPVYIYITYTYRRNFSNFPDGILGDTEGRFLGEVISLVLLLSHFFLYFLEPAWGPGCDKHQTVVKRSGAAGGRQKLMAH